MTAIDGSDFGFRAAEYAIALAEKLHSTIVFVYVVGASSAERNYNISADMVVPFEIMGDEALAKCVEYAKRRSVRFETLLVPGDPGDEILKNAEKMNCDCIVLGKRGLGKTESMLMGSVAEKVSKLADIPVIIVK